PIRLPLKRVDSVMMENRKYRMEALPREREAVTHLSPSGRHYSFLVKGCPNSDPNQVSKALKANAERKNYQ
ncbi:hypothetical protein CEXT_617311, partial [Caerostris extrusa]